jgi:NADPH2:quinone reductase
VIHLSSGGTQLYSAPLGLIMRKRARVTGSLMRPTPLETKSRIAADLMAHVWPLLGEAIVPLVDRVFPLAEVVAAHQVMESGNYIGKLLLSADT